MKKYLVILVLFFSIFCVNASSLDYTIIDNKVLVEINLDSVSNYELKLPYDYKALDINTNYDIIDNKLKIIKAENVSIKYITKSHLEQAKDNSFFIVKGSDSYTFNEINLNLPKEAILNQEPVIFPKNYELETNGRNIIIKWKEIPNSEILVSYEVIQNTGVFLYFFLILLLLILIYVLFNYYKNKKENKKQVKKKTPKKSISKKEELKKSLTKNLFEDEKRIIEYLIEKKDNESWTKDIVKDLNISKVKLSRKLRSLVQKELIKKIPFGNENRIKLIK
ncbi:MAG: helix-turn-helix transcriptional regulator [Nanoarchaeota archaeon]